MEIRVFSRDAVLIDVYDGALSVLAEEGFAEAGSFSAAVPTPDADRFPVEGIVQIPDFGAFVIESVEKDAATGAANIAGRGLLSYFARRALPDTHLYEGAAAPFLTSLAEEGAAVLGAPLVCHPSDIGREISAAVGKGSLLSAMRSVCEAGGIGMRLTLADGFFSFAVREAADSALILTRDNAQLTGGSRLVDVRDYVNRVIVGAAGGHRVTVDAAGRFADGFDDASAPLREKYIYADGLTSDMYKDTAAFTAALVTEGVRRLSRCRPVRSVSVSITDSAARQLGVGTRCGVQDDVLSLHCRALCTAKRVRFSAGKCEYGADLTIFEQ